MKVFCTLAALIVVAFASAAEPGESYRIPLEYHKLDNGLKVVLAPDHTAPTVTVAVYYNIGFRIEPKTRTGFAHLFEHMMFQGSGNLGKMEFVKLVQKNGGNFNGSTRFDFTNYFEMVPVHKLETMLWAEADRMRGLAINQDNLTNQQGVVKNEVKVNVINQPYGGFPWIDMPMRANTNWYNAHNFYGDLEHLDAATLEDVQAFFKTYYAPNNAVVVLVGDIEPKEALAMVKKYFSSIPASNLPPKADITEPRQEQEKNFSKQDTLAFRPALAFAYHVPDRWSPEYFAMGVIDQILAQGDDSRFRDALVKKRGYAVGVSSGINFGLGNMYNYNGPMLWVTSLIHDPSSKPDSIIADVDAIVEDLRTNKVDQKSVDRALVKLRSQLFNIYSQTAGLGKADLLACFALFDDDPNRINTIEDEFKKVTPDLVQKTAQEYLRRSNRTVLVVEPKSSAK